MARLAALAVVMGMVAAAAGQEPAALTGPARHVEEPKGVAVVEMFTSEGCNSCPPADEVMSRLHASNRRNGATGVILLSFHVDYWDRLGWVDRFATAAGTKRQREYAALRGQRPYTPQAVINGTAECIGSDEGKVMEEIRAARRTASATQVTARAAVETKAGEGAVVTVAYTAPTAPAGAVAWAFVVEDGIKSEVKAGENKGRTLRHDRVVRGMGSESAKVEGKIAVAVPGDAAIGGVVVVIQDAKTMKVLGAAETEVVK